MVDLASDGLRGPARHRFEWSAKTSDSSREGPAHQPERVPRYPLFGASSAPRYPGAGRPGQAAQVSTIPPPSRWRAGPARLTQLAVGLFLFGLGEGLVVLADLGSSPWTVLAQGLEAQTALSVGISTLVISFVVLLAWIPLRQRPGLGTVANALVIGLVIDLTVAAFPSGEALAVRTLELLAGIGLVGIGSGFYLGAALGPGPRDGLMTGLQRVTGRPVSLVRGTIEVSALALGFVLGGVAGLGTLAFALLIGPAVALGLRLRGVERAGEL